MTTNEDPADRIRAIRQQVAAEGAKLQAAIDAADGNGHAPDDAIRMIPASNGLFDRIAKALTPWGTE